MTDTFEKCRYYKKRIDALRPFPPETLSSLKEYFRIGLTYTSNAIEGNSLTESETKVLIEDGLTVSASLCVISMKHSVMPKHTDTYTTSFQPKQ